MLIGDGRRPLMGPWNVFLKTHLHNIYIKMDLHSWESLWKVLITIGVGNLFLFFIIVFTTNKQFYTRLRRRIRQLR